VIVTRTIEEISQEIASGIACAKTQTVSNGVLHLRPFSVTEDGRLVTHDAPRIPHSVVPASKMDFDAGDILFNNTNSIELVGKSALVRTRLNASFSNHMTRIRVNRCLAEPGYIQGFLHHLYGRRLFQDRATRWVSQAAFGTSQLKALKIPLPPLEEQRRIVALLDRAAEIRRGAEAARAKARAIIPALFFDTFGDPATNPKGWETVRLGSIAKLTGGGTPSKANANFWGGHIPWVSPKDMKPPIIVDSEDKITEAAMEASPTKLIPAGSILIVVRGMILAHTVPIRFNAVPVTLNQDMKALVPSSAVLSGFLRWALQSLHAYLLSKVREAAHGTKSLESAVLTELSLILPPLARQTAFAEEAHDLEAIVHKLDTAAAKAEAAAAALAAEVFE
jgi:type I restriction enzyme S subunit